MVFSPFSNDFLPSSKNIILKDHPIVYPLKQKDLCGYNPICLMWSGLIFGDIIMHKSKNKVLECHVEAVDRYFTKTWKNIIYMYRDPLQEFNWKKGTHESLHVLCPHLNSKRIKTRQYLYNILKCDTSSDDMKINIDHWLYYFEKFHKQYIIMPTESCNCYATE